MANIKTAISLQEPLFQELEALAHELKISRSRLFALALEEFMRRHQDEELRERINSAYAAEPDPAEQAVRKAMKGKQRRTVEGTW